MITDNLNRIKAELPSGVELVAVSKFHPLDHLKEAYAAGQRIFAESRPQELAAKVPAMPADVQWHFIGHLQTNKLKMVLPYVSLVQSVDSIHLLEAIASWAGANNHPVDILLELHLGAEASKQGFTEKEIESILGKEPYNNIRIRGLMGMATNTEDEEVVEKDFQRIERLFLKYKGTIPGFDTLSIGMSGDWPIAVKHSATMVRIGTDIFGPRV